MVKIDFLFVVLCYRNTVDILTLRDSLSNINGTYRVILVESYYDDDTSKEFEKIAEDNDFDFIGRPNYGYSAGNNAGIKYADVNYNYKFLIISNPDIEVKKLDIEEMKEYKNCIIGPYIKTKKGKLQNPYQIEYTINIVSKLLYIGYLKYQRIYLYTAIIINKIGRGLINFFMNAFDIKTKKVNSLHGSFLIFSKQALKTIGLPFDDNIFLFSEERNLSYLAKKNKIPMIYDRNIEVMHHEDGSVGLCNFNFSKIARESYIYVYEKWNKKGRN